MRNVVAGSDSSALTADGALAEAVDQRAHRAQQDRHVLEQVHARELLQDPEDDARAGAEQPPGDPRRHEEELQRAALEEVRQAVGRVEEVQRVARRRRVEHDRVVAALAVELVELGHRAELLRAGDRARQLRVDAVAQHVVARRRVGRELGDQAVERRLRVEHHRPQLAAHLDAVARQHARRRRAAARCRAPPGRASRPAAAPGRSSPPRRAGRPPPGPAPAPPTPSSCRPRRSPPRCRSACPPAARRCRAHSSCASSSSASRSMSGPPGCSGRCAGACPVSFLSRASCARWRSARRWPRSARATAGCAGVRRQQRRLARAEAIGIQRVGDDALQRQAHALLQRRAQRARLRHRQLLRARDRDHRDLLGVGQHRVDDLALARDRPGAGRRRERARRARAPRRRARSRARRRRRGRRRRRRACGGRAARAPRACRPSAARACPGVAAATIANTWLRMSSSATAPEGSWSRRYSSSASCGSIEM